MRAKPGAGRPWAALHRGCELRLPRSARAEMIRAVPRTPGAPVNSSDLVGRSLSHYDVVEQLGAGGMGVVYRATDTRLNRSVAIKVLPDGFMADQTLKARFLQEARSASAVNHPAIAQIYGVDQADGIDFIAMELVEGRTVRRLVQERELDILGAVEIGIQIAEGLAKAHEAGIVHRDVKTDNVIVTPDGHAKILDFGLARPFQGADGDGLDPEATIQATVQATQAGMVVGTIGYMSPERRGPNRSTTAATSSPWASCCTRWSPASCPSRGTRRWTRCTPSRSRRPGP